MPTLSKEEIKNIKICGKMLSEVLRKVIDLVKPGINAEYLNNIAEKQLRNSGACPSFLKYESRGRNPFPASLCVSINDEVVHGVPTKEKTIHQGDLVGLDLGAEYLGMCTDMAVTVVAGKYQNEDDKKLVETAREALKLGIKAAIFGNTTGDIGLAVQKYVESQGFSVIRALVGHGIGQKPHQDPQVPNFGKKGEGTKLVPNTAIAVEPMIAAGDYRIKTKNDNWTVVTSDGKKAAHYEHTVLITCSKPIIVTQ